MRNGVILAVVLLILGLAAGFFAGMKYQQGKASRAAGQNRLGVNRETRGRSGNGNGIRPVAGEIISADSKSITVKLTDGGSKIVFISDQTEINKTSTAAKDELKGGVTVSVFGQENSDGTVTAQNIQINPLRRFATPSATASTR